MTLIDKVPKPPLSFLAGAVVWTGTIVLAVTGFSLWYFIDRALNPESQPAFVIDAISVKNPVVKPGEPVSIVIQARRFEACPSIIAAFWLDDEGVPVTRFPPTTGGYTSVNTEGYTVTFNVPAPVVDTLTGVPAPPGVYHYKSVNAPLCDRLAPTETPDVAICLIVPGLPMPPCFAGAEREAINGRPSAQ